MKIKKLMRCLLSMTFLLMIFAPVAYGDLYWESVQVRSGSPKGLPKNFAKGLPQDLQKNLPQGMPKGGMPKGLPKDMPKPPPRSDMGSAGDGSQTIKHYLSEVGSRIDTPHDITIVLFKDMTIYQL
ncbi:MAG TPA: hypothetical protein VKA69_03225, partial [Desulfobacteria bacterium]|nr:hypothetical protein [Desulfobacteria bacterium]